MSRFPFRTSDKLSLEGLQSELSSLLDRWWHCGVSTGPLDGQDWAPAVELREERDRYRVTVELPGMDQSQLEVTAEPSSLLVSGEKVQVPATVSGEGSELKDSRVLVSERRYGGFKRRIDLPGPVNIDSITAHLSNGVLDITLLKTPGTTPRDVRIDLQSP